jgi:beta-glucosidase
MSFRKIYITGLLLIVITMINTAFVLSEKTPLYLNPKASTAERVKDLMKRMTLEEKIAQMCQYVGMEHMKIAEKNMSVGEMKKSDAQGFYPGLTSKDIERFAEEGKVGSFLHVLTIEEANYLQQLAQKSRLKIPLLIGIDAIHGNGLVNGSTVYASPISVAASWDDQLSYQIGRETAIEMRATGSHWSFTPNIDVLRDPRWGRSGETFGEDTYMVGNMGVAQIRGLQGDDFSGSDKVIACVKHLLAGSQSLNGLNSAPTDLSERTLSEVFLPPFKRAIKEANVFSVMAAHNEVNGIPCHSDKKMMTDLLRNKWGFKGFYVSDWNDVERIHSVHFAANDFKEAAQLSVDAGLDMHMHGPKFQDLVTELVKEKKLSIKRIDEACSKILEVKFRLGLFESPFIDEAKAKTIVFNKDHQKTALISARKSITLLKNDKLLPLSKSENKKVLIAGPNADNMTILGDWASPQPEENLITMKEGLTQWGSKYGYSMNYVKCNEKSKMITDDEIKSIVEAAENSDMAILVLGENSFRHDWKNKTTGENIDRSTLDLSGRQLEMAQKVKAKLKDKPLIIVFVSGSAISEPWVENNATAVIAAWEPGLYGGQALAEIIFGEVNPSGKTPVTIPRTVGQLQMVYNYKPSMYKHKYHAEKNIPLYHFGYGLSYNTYAYTDLKTSGSLTKESDKIKVSLSVKNEGTLDGEEIVQLYIRDNISSITRPIKELKGYKRVSFKAGESKTIEFELKAEALGFYDANMNFIVEPGDFTIMAGPSSRDKDLIKTTIKVNQKILFISK